MVRVHHSMEHMATGVGGWPLNCIGNLEAERETRKCDHPIKFQSALPVTSSVTFLLLKIP